MDPTTKLNHLKQIPQHEQRSPEWFKQRENKLTSSDAATALGLNPYSKPVELLFKKCGAGKPFEGNVATLHGQKHEDPAIDFYCCATGTVNHEFGLINYDEVFRDESQVQSIPWMAGSTDGIAEDITKHPEDQGLFVLEVKCPFRRKIIHGQCPEYYYPQVQLNMAILNIDKADFIEYNPEGHNGNPRELNIVRIYRDFNWFETNVPILSEFWDEVLLWRTRDIRTHPEYKKYHKKTITLSFNPLTVQSQSSEEEQSQTGPAQKFLFLPD